jgi:hypothetical protein
MAKDVLKPWIGPHGFECRLTLEPVKQLSGSRSIASFQIRECPVLISDTRKNHRQLIRIRLSLLRFSLQKSWSFQTLAKRLRSLVECSETLKLEAAALRGLYNVRDQ